MNAQIGNMEWIGNFDPILELSSLHPYRNILIIRNL
jgi:hypothetical protein